jgi:hypothetical protein
MLKFDDTNVVDDKVVVVPDNSNACDSMNARINMRVSRTGTKMNDDLTGNRLLNIFYVCFPYSSSRRETSFHETIYLVLFDRLERITCRL